MALSPIPVYYASLGAFLRTEEGPHEALSTLSPISSVQPGPTTSGVFNILPAILLLGLNGRRTGHSTRREDGKLGLESSKSPTVRDRLGDGLSSSQSLV